MSVERPTAMEIHEVLAFELFVQTYPQPEFARTELAKLWRDNAETRTKWRTFAHKFETHMYESGLAVRIKSSAKVRQALHALITIPEEPAYRLGDE